jgi:hypothetical protein
MKAWFTDNPLEVDGTTYDVQIIVKDAQSDSTRAAEVATELINSDDVDVLISSGTPDSVDPVSEQCEANSVPCITTLRCHGLPRGDRPRARAVNLSRGIPVWVANGGSPSRDGAPPSRSGVLRWSATRGGATAAQLADCSLHLICPLASV